MKQDEKIFNAGMCIVLAGGSFFFIMSLLGAIDRSEISTAQCAITGGETVYGCLDCCRRRLEDESHDSRRLEECSPYYGYRTKIFGMVKVCLMPLQPPLVSRACHSLRAARCQCC